ncbi:MAG TPA: polysaccharide biosynthesis tyrosine autokinase, partial [Candidatus Synoicihabitans sp.]|nr:polysaccharide biosynthesis tyrosine autokinase [Candidatus Synoicihabitans sp.]
MSLVTPPSWQQQSPASQSPRAQPAGVPPPAGAASGGFSLMLRRSPRELLGMFFDWWWVGLLIAIPAGWGIYEMTPRPTPIYRTDVTLLFESKRDRVLNMQAVVDTALQSATELNIHMEQMRSKTFLDYVLSSFTPEEVKRIQQPYIDPATPNAPAPSLAEIIVRNVQVYTRRGTTIVGIGISNRNAENAALIANRFGRKYIDFTLDRANTNTNSGLIFLRNQAEETRAEVEAAETALQAFRARHSMASLGETKDVTLQKVNSLGSAIVAAQLQQIETKSLLDKVAEYQKANRDLTEIPQIGGAGPVAGPRERLIALQTERNILSDRYLAKHPKILQNGLEIAEARRLVNEGVERALSDIRTKYAVTAQHLAQLQAELAETEQQVRQLDKISVDYRFLEQDAQTKRSAYTNIVNRLNEAKIATQQDNTMVRIFDAAMVPGAPRSTGVGQVLTKAIGAGVVCLFVIPIGIGFFDFRIRTPNHVEKVLNQKLLGAIKPLPKASDQERASAFRTMDDPGLRESWRGIYSEIELASTVRFPKAMIVTSSLPAEGKSQISSNLAAVLATHKRRVLLVDCDVRRPRLHSYFKQKESTGWIDWLQIPSDVRPPLPAGIIKVEENFDLLQAGETPPNPTELIDQLSQRETMQQLLAAYDVVLFDTPPAAVFPDALLLARSCHELVYVVRYR